MMIATENLDSMVMRMAKMALRTFASAAMPGGSPLDAASDSKTTGSPAFDITLTIIKVAIRVAARA